MGQKTNPISLRIHSKIRDSDLVWYSDYSYSKVIAADIAISRYINAFLKSLKLPQSRVSINHSSNTSKIYSFFCYPKHSREYKSKIFRISSGLPKGKNPLRGPKNRTKTQGILAHLTEFQKNLSLNPLSLSRRFFPGDFSGKENKKRIFSLISYLQVLTKNQEKSTQIFQRKTLKHSELSLLKCLTKKGTLKKSINEQEKIIDFFKEFFILSKNITSSYSLSDLKRFQLSKNPFGCSSFQPHYKYTNLLEKNLSTFFKSNVTLLPFQSSSEWQDAGYFADEIVFLLERHIPFRQIKNRILKQFSTNSSLRGIRITCSGRVGGKSKKAQRAKTDSIKYGQTSLNVFSSHIDFAARTAHTPLGSTGVKIWICYK